MQKQNFIALIFSGTMPETVTFNCNCGYAGTVNGSRTSSEKEFACIRCYRMFTLFYNNEKWGIRVHPMPDQETVDIATHDPLLANKEHVLCAQFG